jgi:hypothetical protein
MINMLVPVSPAGDRDSISEIKLLEVNFGVIEVLLLSVIRGENPARLGYQSPGTRVGSPYRRAISSNRDIGIAPSTTA